MNPIVQSFVEQAQSMDSVDALNALLHKVLADLGFSEWAYFKKQPDTDPLVVGNFPEDWVDYYIDQNFSAIDPVVIEGEKSPLSFQWSDLMAKQEHMKAQWDFMGEAKAAGLSDGLAIPIPFSTEKKALLTTVTVESSKDLSKTFGHYQSDLHLMALIYHQCLEELMNHESFLVVKLTGREKEVLKWAAMGKTAWETCGILNISERTVNFHIENSRKKLGATSKQHAVILAVMHKIIDM